MRRFGRVAGLWLALAVLGCGGGGTSSTAPGGTESLALTIEGQVYDGPIAAATVRLQERGGALLQSLASDSAGWYRFEVEADSQAVLRIEVEGGQDLGEDGVFGGPVPDEANPVRMGAVVSVAGRSHIEMSVTPLTTLVARLVEAGREAEHARRLVREQFGLTEAEFDLSPTAQPNVFLANRLARDVAVAIAKLANVTLDGGYERLGSALSEAAAAPVLDTASGAQREALRAALDTAVPGNLARCDLLAAVLVHTASLATTAGLVTSQ